MRVGIFISYSLSPITAGIGYLFRRLVEEMARLDASVEYHLLCFQGEGRTDRWSPPAQARLVQLPLPARLMIDGLWHPFGWPPLERWTGPLDLLHLTSTDWRVPTRMPLVVTCHDLFPERFPELSKPRFRRRRQRALRQMVDEASQIIAVSESTRSDLIERLKIAPERVTRIYPGPLREGEPPPTPSRLRAALEGLRIKSPYFLFVGRQDRRKNLPTLLRAFSNYRARGGIVPSLVIAGSAGWAFHDLQRISRECRLGQSVRFTGYVDDGILQCLYAGATALVYPSLWEGFGFPPLEAMAAGVPVIASTGGAIQEVVGEAALLHEPEDVQALAEAMVRVSRDDRLRGEMIRKGAARVKCFSWQESARRTLEVYGRVAGGATSVRGLRVVG